VVTSTVTGIPVGLCYLTGARCFWSEGTPGRARHTPGKTLLQLRLLCGSSLVQTDCRQDRTQSQCIGGPGRRTPHGDHTALGMHFVVWRIRRRSLRHLHRQHNVTFCLTRWPILRVCKPTHHTDLCLYLTVFPPMLCHMSEKANEYIYLQFHHYLLNDTSSATQVMWLSEQGPRFLLFI
jgi:hypothetical protein